ncbi:hypothetical protein BGZ60DRAFT_533361 [Tricladium varicosporioides]|nr:hypothetical protein BGZ60DRAFT_533361 [Hymenoscyphus varicosporioides]
MHPFSIVLSALLVTVTSAQSGYPTITFSSFCPQPIYVYFPRTTNYPTTSTPPGTFPNGLPSILPPTPNPNSTLISYMEIEPGDGAMTVKIVGSEKPDGDRVEIGYAFGRGLFWYDIRVIGKGLGKKVWLGTDVKNGTCPSVTAAEVGTVSWMGKEGNGGGNCGRREGITEQVNLVVDIC